MPAREASLQIFPSSPASKGSTAHKWPQSPRFEECPFAADTHPATSNEPVTYCSGKWSSVQSTGTTAAPATAAATTVRCCSQPHECKCTQGEYGLFALCWATFPRWRKSQFLPGSSVLIRFFCFCFNGPEVIIIHAKFLIFFREKNISLFLFLNMHF